MGYLINLRLNKLQTAKVKAQKIIEKAPQVRISLKVGIFWYYLDLEKSDHFFLFVI